MFVKDEPTVDELLARARALRNSPVTYPAAAVGATVGQGDMPGGYRHDRFERVLGTGEEAWEAAKVAVMDWSAQRRAGVQVAPSYPPVADEVVMISFKVPKAYVVAGCRIVAVVDEPDRVGFAYGTLPGHPERGEEAFLVERSDDGTVTGIVTAFSRAADPIVRLGGPVARRMQKRTIRLYLEGLAAAVGPGPSDSDATSA